MSTAEHRFPEHVVPLGHVAIPPSQSPPAPQRMTPPSTQRKSPLTQATVGPASASAPASSAASIDDPVVPSSDGGTVLSATLPSVPPPDDVPIGESGDPSSGPLEDDDDEQPAPRAAARRSSADRFETRWRVRSIGPPSCVVESEGTRRRMPRKRGDAPLGAADAGVADGLSTGPTRRTFGQDGTSGRMDACR